MTSAVLFLLLAFSDTMPKNPPQGPSQGLVAVKFEARSGAFRIELSAESFVARRHRITFHERKGYFVDGATAYGFHPDVCKYRLSGFKVWYNDRPIPIPRKLWAGCFDPHVWDWLADSFSPIVRTTKEKISLSVDLADASAGCTFVFHIYRNGKTWRQLKVP
ncbi:MAG: hypothetical protein HONBIEJF_02591 [Fimbriimonadaceae bacterium]|nr:hypothetical protein [Fimbriimonadaceae bacterium]